MIEAPVVQFPGGSRITRPRRAAREVVAERTRPSALGRAELQRAANREGIGPVAELRCECGGLSCHDLVPGGAETYRGRPDRFVVSPSHFVGGVVVRAADRFFVVEVRRPPALESRSGLL